MNGGVTVPDRLIAPEYRWAYRVVLAARSRRIAIRMLDQFGGAMNGIKHRDEIRAFLGRAVDRAVGVDGGITLVRRNRVVEIHLGRTPLPRADDHVALDPFRTLRLVKRQFAGGDAVGPVREHAIAAIGPEATDRHRHVGHRLAGLQAAFP